MGQILVINGPNLNLLGSREPEIYGQETLEDISTRLAKIAETAGHNIDFFQSNAENDLINRVHQAGRDQIGFIVINPGAFTHTSIALRDALLGVDIPFIEIHLSNVFAREAFRHKSYLSDVAKGVISGLGSQGYEFALNAALRHFDEDPNNT